MIARRMFIGCTVLWFSSCAFAQQPSHAAYEVEQHLSKLRFQPRGDELPLDLLTLDVTKRQPRQISFAQAKEDVERLFHLFSHGYAGYAFVTDERRWQEAKAQVLTELENRSSWQVALLPSLWRARLPFIRDCHVRIGKQRFADHYDFWYDTSLEVHHVGDEYRCSYEGKPYSLVNINGQDPAQFIVRSLNQRGAAIHRIGMLAQSPPRAAVVELAGESGRSRVKLPLRCSDFDHFADRIVEHDRIGGIPVVRVRSFGDHHSRSLERWLDSASQLRGEPCVIVDLRGNAGGNERWAIEWIRRFSDETVPSVFIGSELNSRTTMAGRVNAFTHWTAKSPENEYLREQAERYRDRLARFRPGGQQPFWTEPRFPRNRAIPNPSTIVVITNATVASAGEGFVMRVSQLENVVVVGENTQGALTFGNISLHQLPNSGLEVWLPINFGLFPDLAFREEKGLAPDFWVPAADALNFAVAALRSGTIVTARPIPSEWLAQRFVPEDTQHWGRKLVLASLFAVLGLIWSFWRGRSGITQAVPGVVWLAIGAIWLVIGSAKDKRFMVDLGAGFLVLGMVLTISGLRPLLKQCTKNVLHRAP